MYMNKNTLNGTKKLSKNSCDLINFLLEIEKITISVRYKTFDVVRTRIDFKKEIEEVKKDLRDSMLEAPLSLSNQMKEVFYELVNLLTIEDIKSMEYFLEEKCGEFWKTFHTNGYLENEESIDAEYRVVVGDEYKDAFGHVQHNYYQVMIVPKCVHAGITFIFFDNELNYVKEQETQCKRLDDALALLRNTNSIATGLSMNVYRNSLGDSTNRGVSSKINCFDVVGEKIKDGLEIKLIREMLYIDYIKLGNYPPHYFAKQVCKNKGHFMMGGNFIYTPDSRNGYEYPLPIHDRQENN